MYLENIVVDAADPRALGRFWEAALGAETLTDSPDGFETRLAVPDGPVLDLCFQPVAEPVGPQRVRLVLRRGQGELDPEGNRFVVAPDPQRYADDSPLAAVSLAVADPGREQEFWSWLTGWVPTQAGGVLALRHPSRRGPLLELVPEETGKGAAKSRMHLDVRLEAGEDVETVAREISDRGGRPDPHPEWGELPWWTFVDPSGNEFCVLPAQP